MMGWIVQMENPAAPGNTEFDHAATAASNDKHADARDLWRDG
jgi:hypothetical protein